MSYACLGFDSKLLSLAHHPLSYWKEFIKQKGWKCRFKAMYIWQFRNFATFADIPKDGLPKWNDLFWYLKLLIAPAIQNLDGDGI